MIDGNENGLSLIGESDRGLTERIKVTTVLGKPNDAIQFSPEYRMAIPDLRTAFDSTWVWHGTGRYQYDPRNRNTVRDVLQTIISEDGLIPHTDVLDFTQGKMESVSTSPARLYSLMYAQCHFEKGHSFFGYGRNGLIWSYYLAPMAWRGLIETFIDKNPDYTQMLDKTAREEFSTNASGFHDKYSQIKPRKSDMFKGGVSDIAENYPILIGIKSGSFEQSPIGKLLDKHELRSQTPISIENFTHFEVPENKVQEVKMLLQQANKTVPVYPIEWGTEYSKQLPLKKILDG
ncbi:hypothetical protein HGA88_06140 [Candidatus Roizmanbacteria bacterium]|nr:hypothetical protein [Candidatus Roizmanbacteria bacterium]